MFNIGMPELILIFLIALIILGPKKLPEIARAIGKGIVQFRRALNVPEEEEDLEEEEKEGPSEPERSESTDNAAEHEVGHD